jgi:hydrocephalus-inducing protein
LKVEKSELNWGKIPSLTESQKRLKMTNDSLIPAEFKLFVKSKRPYFSINMDEGVLAPNESISLILTAFFDEPTNFDGELHISIKYANTIIIKLSGKGIGSTVLFPEWLSKVEFGKCPANLACTRRVTLENRGRLPQVLEWHNEKVRKGRRSALTEPDEQVFFEVVPPQVLLAPGASFEFEVL